MLGIESPRKPITGQFAKELREALVRARTTKNLYARRECDSFQHIQHHFRSRLRYPN